MPPDISDPGNVSDPSNPEMPSSVEEETQIAAESEEDLRLKLRHVRTAHKELARAAERDGLYGPQIAELEKRLEDLAQATERALFRKRETQ